MIFFAIRLQYIKNPPVNGGFFSYSLALRLPLRIYLLLVLRICHGFFYLPSKHFNDMIFLQI